MEREVIRTAAMKGWVEEWARRHADELRGKKAAEEAKKLEEEQKRRRSLLSKAEESIVEKEEKPVINPCSVIFINESLVCSWPIFAIDNGRTVKQILDDLLGHIVTDVR